MEKHKSSIRVALVFFYYLPVGAASAAQGAKSSNAVLCAPEEPLHLFDAISRCTKKLFVALPV